MRRALVLLLAVGCVVLAGCSIPFVGHPEEPRGGDAIGWENGYWYDDPVDVTTSDGLNESEREAVTARTMARIERIRDREFTSTVPVEVVSRAEYRDRSRSNGSGAGPGGDPWNDQVWESLLLVGESEGSDEAISDTRDSSVLGYYSPSEDRIVVVSPSDTPVIDRGTLAHELVHALQDQQFGLDGSPETQDTQLSRNGVVEGEANYVQRTYEQRCRNGWSCIERPDSDGGGGGSGGGQNSGVFTVIIQPYVSGPGFIDTVYDRGGWGAVDALHDDYPDSSEQVIHPERYPGETPVEVTVADRSNAEWERFDRDPVGDTVGEASIFATMYHNDRTAADRYSFVSRPSEGWAGDTVVPYRNGDGGGGYVWESRWDSERDARQFANAYRGALTGEHDARNPRGNVYVVPEDSEFADAFRIVRSGRTVRIVNGPTVDDLSGIHRSGG
ncbi:Hvo_1808 family surface protein [Haloarcula sp. S1CR25-12]|uniref:Hvo_1808 family surface protein n=1 Tax=Haloarcula saliterrae TaxID=2950534 RepID=A0ABU2FIN1_9EURY|nr:Hvo_1808 family surface protein [Haloarcula sp. S1CR25-12]MDS0261631.1 Hvo_1808 family surface protein [Haloarcula sp. S1CR25-12]